MANRTFVSTLTFKAVDNASAAVRAIGGRLQGAMAGIAASAAAAGRATAAVSGGTALAGVYRAHEQMMEMSKAQNDLAAALVLNGQNVASAQINAARSAQIATRLSIGTAHRAPEVLRTIAEGAKSGLQTLENSLAAVPDLMQGAQAARTPLDQYAETLLGVAMALNKVNKETGQLQNGGIQRLNQMMVAYGADAPGKMDRIFGYLRYFAPFAQQMGLSDEFITAAATSMARQNIQAESAGVAMRSLFNRLQNPTAEGSQALRRAGIDFTDFIRRNEQGQPIDAQGRVQRALNVNDIAQRIGQRFGKVISPEQRQQMTAALEQAGGRVTDEVVSNFVNTIGQSWTGSNGFNPRDRERVTQTVEQAVRAVNPIDNERLFLAIAAKIRDGVITAADLAKIGVGQQVARNLAAFAESQQFLDKYRAAFGNNQVVGQAADAQLQGYERAVKGLADQFQRISEALRTSGIPDGILNTLASGLSRVADAAERLAGGNASNLEKFAAGFAFIALAARPLGMVAGLVMGLARAVGFFSPAARVLAAVGAAFTLIGEKVGILDGQLGQRFNDFIAGFTSKTKAMEEAIQRLKEAMGGNAEGQTSWWDRFTDTVRYNGITAIFHELVAAARNLREKLDANDGTDVSGWYRLGEAISDAISTGIRKAGEWIDWLIEKLKALMNLNIQDFIQRNLRKLADITEIGENARPTATTFADWMEARRRFNQRQDMDSWANRNRSPLAGALGSGLGQIDQQFRPLDPTAIQNAIREGASQSKPKAEVTGSASVSVNVTLSPEARQMLQAAATAGRMQLGTGRTGTSNLGTPQE